MAGCYEDNGGGSGGGGGIGDIIGGGIKPGGGTNGVGGIGGGSAAGGFNLDRFGFGSLFRSRAFLQSSLQARTEVPDPLFPRRKPRTPFGLLRRNSAGV